MLFSNACLFVLVSLVSLSANAETVRGAQRELSDNANVTLGVAGNFAILAKTGITTVPDSAITGDIAVSPIGGAAMTGFTFTKDSSGTFATAPQLSTGNAYAADYTDPTPTKLIAVVGAMMTAYDDAAGRTNDDASRINLKGGILTEETLTPGVYTFTTDLHLTGNIAFDGEGDSDAIFIIQIAGNLKQDAVYRVNLVNGAKAENIFWQIAGNVEVMERAHMEGVLLVKTDVTFITSSSLTGRVFAQTACNLQMATITEPFHANFVDSE
jgi:hypothetical protein